MANSLADQLREHGLAGLPPDDEFGALSDLRSLLRQGSRGRRIPPATLNSAVDAATRQNSRVDEEDAIDCIAEAISGWARAGKREPASHVYLGRLFVFCKHDSVSLMFRERLASYLACHLDGQFPDDRWTRLAKRLSRRSDRFKERVDQAWAPFRRDAMERERVLNDLRWEEQRKVVADQRSRVLHRAAALEALGSLVQRISSENVRVVRVAPEITDADVALCVLWGGHSSEKARGIRNHVELEALLGPYEANRLLSARLAERVAADFYRDMQQQVRDTSVLQLADSDARWKTHDLEADGKPLDVKNARRSFTSRSTYSEWCVNRYKTLNRASGSEHVRLVGVLSDYVPMGRIDEMTGGAEVTILGESTRQSMADIGGWARSMTEGRLELLDPAGARFLAGWCFDYPAGFYKNLPEVLAGIPSRYADLLAAGVRPAELPGIVRLIAGVGDDGDDKAAMSRLGTLRNEVGLSRLGAVAFALVELVRAAAGDDIARPANVSHMLFPVGRHGPLLTYPLLRYDPEQQVAAIVAAIEQVWKSSRTDITRFQRFRIAGTGIFQGAEQGGQWVTILAYCGGWRRTPPIARCGTSPLLMGTHETCPTCMHLICCNCGFCGTLCPDCGERQESMR